MYFLKYDKLIFLIYVKIISNGGYNMHYKTVKGILSNDNTIYIGDVNMAVFIVIQEASVIILNMTLKI